MYMYTYMPYIAEKFHGRKFRDLVVKQAFCGINVTIYVLILCVCVSIFFTRNDFTNKLS